MKSFGMHEMWIGAGVMIGGTLAVAGVESVSGVICRADSLSHPSNWWKFSSDLGFRLGIGLGASVQAQAIIVLGSQFFTDISNAQFGGAELNIAYTEKIPFTSEASTALKIMTKMEKVSDITKLSGVGIFALQQMLNNFTNVVGVALGKLPQAFNFDIPAAAYGLELSGVYCFNYKLHLIGL
jgi:hypothetical protein